MNHSNPLEFQSIDSDIDYAALAAWVHRINDLMKNILEDLEDGPDEEDFDRISFDQSLEQDLHCLLLQCPADPFSLDVDSRSINPYLTAFIISLEQEIVYQDVDHFQLLSPSLLLGRVRDNLDSSEVDKARENLKRNERKTRVSLLRYILNLKAAYSKLMIIRLDLYTQDWVGSIQRWELLKKFISQRFMGFYIGYAVKFEFGMKRGVHLHTLLFFNGSRVRKDVTIAKAIGEYWKSSVTDGEGTYSNCNAPEHVKRMRYPAVGTFHEFDERTFKGLEHIASYLTEQDLVVRFAVPGLSRSFRKGVISREKSVRINNRAKWQAKVS
ncbi:inovirus-type Gp2 protein [Comamonas sp. UBA7528]|uniref:inovirus-type Gp2 protein n=1 Tax=Comamonas sp. UBA7528 TaxID=1946391 RepID=UPI0025C331B4|nr:inovirus-type Gp2 protein [Comamonas sp. UBA7528]